MSGLLSQAEGILKQTQVMKIQHGVFFCGLGLSLIGQTTFPFGLPRHDAGKSTVESPAASPQAKDRKGVKYLALAAGQDWSRPLRGKKGEQVFISLSMSASVGTIFELGPARLGLVPIDIAGYAQLAVDETGAAGPKWRELGLHAPLEKFDGQPLASFDILTLRLDPAHGTFDLYQGASLLHADLKLADLEQNKIVIRPGSGGAWLHGLVQSDDNPLYADANRNGIDDTFEQSKHGKLAATTLSKPARKQLATDWQADQAKTPAAVPALFVQTPRPDGK
jgi:hypothetical protein